MCQILCSWIFSTKALKMVTNILINMCQKNFVGLIFVIAHDCQKYFNSEHFPIYGIVASW